LNIWKKAISAGLTAMLIASFTVSASFATKGLAGQSDQTDALACTAAAVATAATCSQVADGISTVTLGGDPDLVTTGYSLYISAAGASIIAVAGDDFVLAGGAVTTGLAPGLTTADTITLRAPSAPGTATVSVYTISSTTGIATLEGTLAITFTATSGLNVSEVNSTVKIVADTTCAVQTVAKSSAPAALPSAAVAGLCVTLKDGNGTALAAGAASVAVTITPIGLVSNGTSTGQTVSLNNGASGVANFSIWNTGLSGVATIAIAVTQGTTTTTFAAKTFTFSGSLATLTLSNKGYAGDINNVPAGSNAVVVEFVGKDTAGNNVSVDILNASPWTGITLSASAPFTVTATTDYTGGTTKGSITVTCGDTAGSGTVTLKSGTITSNTVTVVCSDIADSITAAFDKTTVVPGGTATFTATLKDADGLIAPDGSAVTVLTSSGVTFSSTGTFSATTKNGIATFTYLAPFNTGVTTVTAFNADAGSASASITVGAVVPPGTTFNTTGSALGNTLTGPFTSSTKISTGGYITWRFDGGVAMAGKTIEIWAYKKVGLFTNPWSAPYLLTTRVANASGVAFANITSGSVIWLSLRPVLPATATDAAVWGSWSIGRWIH